MLVLGPDLVGPGPDPVGPDPHFRARPGFRASQSCSLTRILGQDQHIRARPAYHD